MSQTLVGNLNNVMTTIAARAVIAAYTERMYHNLPYVMFYLNFDDGGETATISFYNEAEQDRWPVGRNERCVGVTALGLIASKQYGGENYLLETFREVLRHCEAGVYTIA